MPASAEIVARSTGGQSIRVVEARGEVANVLRGLASDRGEINEAANVSEHFCKNKYQNLQTFCVCTKPITTVIDKTSNDCRCLS